MAPHISQCGGDAGNARMRQQLADFIVPPRALDTLATPSLGLYMANQDPTETEALLGP